MEANRCPGCMKLKSSSPVCEHCGFDENSRNSNHQLSIGTVLKGQYVIGKVLGQGGFGITYLGWDTFLKMPVAIKEYYPSGIVMRDSSYSNGVANCEGQTGSGFDRNRQRFLREAQALAKLGDVPEVVHVLGFFPENGTAYIVMEYVQGQTLKDRIQKQGTLNTQEMLAIFGPVLDGLQSVHDAGLIHRDISPDNIVLMPEGGVKLLDFGAVRDYAGEHSSSTEAILKAGYAPLEQYQRRGDMGPKTDLYALCGTIYYCMTGQVPPDAPERMMDGVEPEWEKIPGLSKSQANALRQGMALSIQDRVSSASELKKLLLTPGVEPEPRPEPAEPSKPTRKEQPAPKKRIRKLPIVASALLVLGLLVLVWGKAAGQADQAQSQMVPEATETTLPPETEAMVPETTEAPTEPQEEVYPCYVTYTDDGMVVTGEGLQVTVTKDWELTAVAEGFAESEQIFTQNNQYRAWKLAMHAEDKVYELATIGSVYGATGAQLNIYDGPKAYSEYRHTIYRMSSTGCFWRCIVPQTSSDDPSVEYSFDYRNVTRFEVTGEKAEEGSGIEVHYHRVYELAGEIPPEEAAAAEPGENLYPAGNHKERYPYTTTHTPDGILLEGENLEVSFSNDRDLRVTLKNVPVKDSYYIRTTGNMGTALYGWSIGFYHGDNCLIVSSEQYSNGERDEYWMPPEYMDNGMYWMINHRVVQDLHEIPLKKTQFLENSVIWEGNIPTYYYGDVDIDMDALTEVIVYVYDSKDRMQLTRTYQPEA